MDEPPAFADKHEELEQTARKVARQVLGADHAGVEDVVNDSLARLSDRWEVLNHEKSLRPYVTVVARHLAIDEQRKQERLEPLMTSLEGDEATAAVEDELAGFLAGEYQSIGSLVANREVLEDALNTLDPDTRHMVKLRVGYGFTNKQIAQSKQIAESLGANEEAVGKRIQRAIPVLALLLWDTREALLGKHRPDPKPLRRAAPRARAPRAQPDSDAP